MFKNSVSASVKVGERIYTFLCDAESDIQEVVHVLDILKNAASSALEKAKSESSAPIPESQPKE